METKLQEKMVLKALDLIHEHAMQGKELEFYLALSKVTSEYNRRKSLRKRK